LVGELKGAAKNPGVFLSQLNRKLHRILKETEIPMFASAAYVVLDLAACEMRWANAGHPDPIWVHQQATGARTEPIIPDARGPVLGMFEEARYDTTQRPVSIGDRVLLFTDGLFEVESAEGVLYDKEALLDAIARRKTLSLEALCRGVLEEVQQFAAHQHFSDDVCLVGAEVMRLLPPVTDISE
jgi:sigma-B regulation protein RsbU (phosphoserine phosphatase)